MRSPGIEGNAARLHRECIVVDGHCDILIPLTEGKMTLDQRVELPDPAAWEPPLGYDIGPFADFGISAHTSWFGCMGQYDLPRWREGGITAPPQGASQLGQPQSASQLLRSGRDLLVETDSPVSGDLSNKQTPQRIA